MGGGAVSLYKNMAVDCQRAIWGLLSVFVTVFAKDVFLRIARWVLRNKLTSLVFVILGLYVYVRAFDAHSDAQFKYKQAIKYSHKCVAKAQSDTDKADCHEYDMRKEEYFSLRVLRTLGGEVAKDGKYAWSEFYWPLLSILTIVILYSTTRILDTVFGFARDISDRRRAQQMYQPHASADLPIRHIQQSPYVYIQDVTPPTQHQEKGRHYVEYPRVLGK